MSLVNFHFGENNINTGPLNELPEVCIDHFIDDSLNSSVFFLSHVHTDHLVGLETAAFLRRLQQPGIKLYCHPLTPILLCSFKRYLGGLEGISALIKSGKIHPLDINTPHNFNIHRKSSKNCPAILQITVTLLPAGHCPGSVMFLFETTALSSSSSSSSPLRILHTGDFRLDLQDLQRMSPLHERISSSSSSSSKRPKAISHLYVDTTFCSLSSSLFPSRKAVISEAITLFSQWITLSPRHIIDLRFSAKFAHEYILLELFKAFSQKIHVTSDRQAIYANIPELHRIVTVQNPENSQFHLCGSAKSCLASSSSPRPPYQIKTVKFSSMWYTSNDSSTPKPSIAFRGANYMSICYSMHSSLDEIAQTIDYLKPKIVTPLVLPKNAHLSQVQKALQSKTTAKYQFVDYHSKRGSIGGQNLMEETLCDIEKDETYLKEEEEQEEEEDEEEEDKTEAEDVDKKPDNLDDLDEDEPVPKLPKFQYVGFWNFQFSPSSESDNSQSSEEEDSSSKAEENSSTEEKAKETDKPTDNHCFLQPLAPPKKSISSVVNCRRNLQFEDSNDNNYRPLSPPLSFTGSGDFQFQPSTSSPLSAASAKISVASETQNNCFQFDKKPETKRNEEDNDDTQIFQNSQTF